MPMSDDEYKEFVAFYANRPEERAEPNEHGCTCPCCACRDNCCAMCEMGYP